MGKTRRLCMAGAGGNVLPITKTFPLRKCENSLGNTCHSPPATAPPCIFVTFPTSLISICFDEIDCLVNVVQNLISRRFGNTQKYDRDHRGAFQSILSFMIL